MIFGKHTILLLLIFVLPLFAQLSPGELHKSHQALEGLENCTACHEAGKGLSADKCLKCHQLLSRRIAAGKGLHAGPDFKKCRDCHIEHQGREFDLIYWKEGQDRFDHSATGYNLAGSHARLKCRQCHQPQNMPDQTELIKNKKDVRKTFLGLNRACLSCHTDQHRTQLGTDCARCHDNVHWKPTANFNHDRAGFKLTGQHKSVDCRKCHSAINDKKSAQKYIRYKNIAYKNCTDCHSDQHKGRLGPRCAQCHSTAGWRSVASATFNHDKTRYPLRGRHAALKCVQCHEQGRAAKRLKFAKCTDCHRDFHRGQFAGRSRAGACEECHTVQGFRPAQFTLASHDQSDFPLKGAHQAVPCVACHKKEHAGPWQKTPRFTFKSTGCADCHSNVHGRSLDKISTTKTDRNQDICRQCHNEQDWAAVAFDHQVTGFLLDGRHGQVTCLKCHRTQHIPGSRQRRVPFSGLQAACSSCHQDIHQGQFAGQNGPANCALCHTPDNWKAALFNHKSSARFALDGAHEKVPCASCHKKEKSGGAVFVRYKPLPSTCIDCHGPGGR